MNLIDWVLLLVVLAYAISGYWQGFITGAFSTIGLVLGGVFGIWVAPHLLGQASPSVLISVGALFIVLVCASFGQAVLQFVGAQARAAIPWQPVRAVDAVGGAALSIAAVLVVAWMLGVAVSGAQIPGVTPMVRGSEVLTRVDAVMPDQAQRAMRSFDRLVGSSIFPRYLEPFAREQIIDVAAPPRGVAAAPGVRRAGASVFKIRGHNRCGSGVEGSGFLYAPGRLMTNAHVVAGVTEPRVSVDDGDVPATVVYYNSDLDVAILDVRLTGPTLRLDKTGQANQAGAILGYPNDGPFDARPIRIRAEQRLRSPDIYGRGTVTREVFSLRGKVRPGNSGGPVVSRAGTVIGVVFAASVTDDSTGYALTADQVSEAAARGIAGRARVSSGNCT